jgi:hypothetical protein
MYNVLMRNSLKKVFLLFRISFGFCGRFTGAELMSFSLSITIVCVWVLTGHWLLMDGTIGFF